jgi:hypothetical protein
MAYWQSSVAVLRQRKISLCFLINDIRFFKGINRVFQGNLSYFVKTFVRLNYVYVINKPI